MVAGYVSGGLYHQGHRENYLRTGKARRTVQKLIYMILITYTAQAEPWMARACRRLACAHDLSCLSLICFRVFSTGDKYFSGLAAYVKLKARLAAKV